MDADVIVIGAGISGMTIAARLQARGLRTLVLEAHTLPGGCAGYYRKAGFSLDVGATTLVDFGPGGVGGRFLDDIGLQLPLEHLPGYRAWLPDRTVTLHRREAAWHDERLRAFGSTPGHRRFWSLMDELATVFWHASRDGVRLPLRSPAAALAAARTLPAKHWALARYLGWTVDDALATCDLQGDTALRQFLNMLIQDTVHGDASSAPLINSALGITIRGAGLSRPRGGARGLWEPLVRRYRELGGRLLTATPCRHVSRSGRDYAVHTDHATYHAPQVVSTLPAWNTARIGPPDVRRSLEPYLRRDGASLGGALVLHLGVPEAEVHGQDFTHHQLLTSYTAPLGNGNNAFVSVSSPGDTRSAPAGWRAVMISTHCELEDWEELTGPEYTERKTRTLDALLAVARRVYPNLGERAALCELGTPRTYARFTGRHRGAVGGVRLTLRNSNQHALAFDIGVPGFWQAGDTVWPGLGTVACVLTGSHVAGAAATYAARRPSPRPAPPRAIRS